MKNLAPDIFRQRLLIEGYFSIDVTRDEVDRFLRNLPEQLSLRTYGDPVIHSPAGDGREVNQGFDAFVPLIDSGISLYVWSSQKFFSVVVFSCKAFSTDKAVAFAREFFATNDELEHEEF